MTESEYHRDIDAHCGDDLIEGVAPPHWVEFGIRHAREVNGYAVLARTALHALADANTRCARLEQRVEALRVHIQQLMGVARESE